MWEKKTNKSMPHAFNFFACSLNNPSFEKMLDAYGEKLEKHFILLLFVTSSPIFQIITGATDSISSGQVLRDGETMASSDGKFEMGFFSPGKSKNRYLGMWFKNIADRRIVWVANREIPITSSTGALKLMESGLLVLLNDTNGIIIWSSNMSRSVENPIAQLLDSGNLVMRDASDERPENYLWQSFDHPTDTYIAGMKCGWNLAEGLETYILSWRSEDDPTPGEFTINLDPTGYPQVVLKRGQSIRQRAGPWNGLAFSGILHSREDPRFNLTLVENQNEVYFLRSVSDNSIPTIDWLSPSGIDQRWTWVNKTQEWVLFYNLPADNCDNYRLCGANGICGMENFVSCGCLDGFVPKDEQSWNKGDWLNGCVRTTNLSCQGDFFLKQSGIKMPDARNSSFNKSTTLEECKLECLRNCLCTAYTQLDIRNGGSGCLLYFGDLIDIRKLYKDGQDLYIRIAASDLGFEDDAVSNKGRKRVQLITSITLAGGVVLLGLSLILYVVKRKKIAKMRAKGSYLVSHAKDPELPLFKLSTILKATDNFSINNKLGEGGFGPVYKGVLEEGQEIAVKRLSETSMQGVEEFKNEAVLIAKLQHRNLVRLLGCCIQGEEIMLIYEYLPNKSLDLFLFDQTKCQLLDWAKRFHIINGIARGLMYLHHDSRLRIIHRDLKTSNILLDSDMNAKISDFGMARSFRGNEIEAKTHRVVGTYGYMSPEYAVHGLFSQKSDVYSFGVMLLELVSGKRNREYSRDGQNLNLLGYAWTLYKEDRSIELVDASLGTSFHLSEAVRSIHLGLLCVQGRPEDRPTMSSVVFMLRNEIVLPEAKHPGFFMERYDDVCQKSIEIDAKPTNSVNEVSITLPEGR